MFADVVLLPKTERCILLRSECRCGRSEPSPSADMGSSEPSPGADVGRGDLSPGADVGAARLVLVRLDVGDLGERVDRVTASTKATNKRTNARRNGLRT